MLTTCDYCGNEYEIYPSKYNSQKNHFCSSVCFNNYSIKERVIDKCAYCGKNIYKTPSDVAWKKKKYCSRKCAGEARRKQIVLTCELCEKTFTVPVSWGKRKYCSTKCKGLASRNRVERECSYCGKTIERQKAKADVHPVSYCSSECMNKHLSESMNEKMKLGIHPFQDEEVRRRNNISQSKNKYGLSYIENLLYIDLKNHGINTVPNFRVEYIKDALGRKRYIYIYMARPIYARL